jgi:HD-GYP domain-containing protein (c-di-GMP phosphodiesterase class II)
VAIRPRVTTEAPPSPDRPEVLRFLAELSRLLSEHLSITDELSSVSGELSHRHSELELLYSISHRLSGQEDMRKAIRLILDQARGAVGAKCAFLSIPEKRILEAAVAGENGENGGVIPTNGSWERVARLAHERCRRSSRHSFSGSQWDLDSNDPLFTTPAQILSVSLHTNGDVRGVLGLVHFDPVMKPRPGDLKLLDSIAERISMAVASSDLYENLKDFLMATVKSLVSALEAKDSYTCGHSERVNLLSMLIGKTMGLADDDLEVLRWASILHDVGKIGMPESILKKPGRLTAEEFEIMKEHPDRGYKVLSPIRQLATASLAVRFHHEMIDGLGYPLGLRNGDIPIFSRVIAVADTYDALTSTRSYRPSRSADQAFSVIHSVRGSQLDAGVVDVLATLMPFIREHEVMLKVGIPDMADDLEEDEGEARAA